MASPEFDAAVETVNSGTKPVDNATKLMFYSLYKQATQGDVTGDRPGFMDMVGRAKFDAWERLKGMSQEDAEAKYIDEAGKL